MYSTGCLVWVLLVGVVCVVGVLSGLRDAGLMAWAVHKPLCVCVGGGGGGEKIGLSRVGAGGVGS
jgi:hypothetical protein